MIRVLLVDDERLIRIAVRNITDWKALGYEIIGEASNGLEALEMAGSLQPDLIFLDINIPVIDGLEVCRSLRERSNPAKIIILTGYDTFEYARACIRLNVLDYLVKPLFKEDVEKCLLEVRSQFEEAGEGGVSPGAGAVSAGEEAGSFGERAAESAAESAPEMNIREVLDASGAPECYLAVIRQDPPVSEARSGNLPPGAGPAEMQEWCRGFAFPGERLRLVTSDSEYVYLLLSGWDLNAKFRLKELQKMLRQKSVSASICVNTDPLRAGCIAEALSGCLQELAKTFYSGPGSFFEISLKDPEPAPGRPVFDFLAFHRYLNTQPENFLTFMQQDLERVMSARPSQEQLFLYSIRIINAISDYAETSKITVSDNLRSNLESVSGLNKCHYAEQLYRYIMETCRYLLCDLDARKHKNSLIEDAVRYIDLHYADPSISLSDIAKGLFVNPSYLSRAFRREMNMTVTEYITTKRIDQAFMLIMTGKYTRVSDVARMVGYSDSLYFSKTFKKVRGVPPSKYFE